MNAEIKDMTDEQIADLETQIKVWRKEKECMYLAWKPEYGQEYLMIDNYSEVSVNAWENDDFDQRCYDNGNCFRTAALAHAELKRRQVKRQIEELIDKYDSERGGAFIVGEENCYFMCYEDGEEDYIVIGTTRYSKGNNLPCFSSREVAERILEEIGGENIKLLFTEYPIVREE